LARLFIPETQGVERHVWLPHSVDYWEGNTFSNQKSHRVSYWVSFCCVVSIHVVSLAL
jgi:hypothetical protein